MTLPRGWTCAPLGDVTLPRVDQREPGKSFVSYIDIGSIDRNSKRVGVTEKVNSESAPTRARQWVCQGDVLVSMTRPNLNAVAMVTPELDGAVASTGFDILRPIDVLAEWIFYRVRSHAFVQDVCQDIQGVVYPAIRPDDVRRHVLPIPPSDEQRRIVEAVDSYLSRLDTAVASLERAQVRLKSYRASVLKAAVEGRLVPTEAELARAEKRDYEPADILLKRILAERRRRWEEAELSKFQAAEKTQKDDKWQARYQEPAPQNTTDLPELPKCWCWTTLGALLSEPLRNGHSAPKTRSVGGVRTLTLSAVTESDFGVHNTKLTVADPLRVSDLWLRPGDIFIERSNTPELVGTAALYNGISNFAIFPDLLIRARCVREVLPEYLHLALTSPRARLYFQKAAQGIAGSMPKISQATIERLPVALPPYAEQHRVVDEMQRLRSVESTVLNEVVQDQNRCQRLRQAVLKWAFEGKLVDQNPNDEPAEKLLERIRAERVAAASATKSRVRKAKAAR